MADLPKPIPLDDIIIAFPASALSFMPEWDDIPKEFRDGTSQWCDFAYVWFNHGLSDKYSFVPATIDGQQLDAAMIHRQLQAIMGSFAPKHEHKIATVGYLASIWMESMIYGYQDEPLEKHVALGEGTLEEWIEYFNEQEAK